MVGYSLKSTGMVRWYMTLYWSLVSLISRFTLMLDVATDLFLLVVLLKASGLLQ